MMIYNRHARELATTQGAPSSVSVPYLYSTGMGLGKD